MQMEMLVIVIVLCDVLTVASCPEKCVCHGITLTCSRSDFPLDIPANITQVYLSNFNLDNLHAGTFDNTEWKNVTFLDLHAEQGDTLPGRVFIKLENLKYLGIHGDDLKYIDPSCFEGLDKVHTLNLSNNYRLNLDRLSSAWDRSKRQVLISMEYLIISALNFFNVSPIDLEYEFFNSISFDRKLKYLDISYTNIAVLDATQLYLLCDSIVHIKAHGAYIAGPKGFQNAAKCESLLKLDITDTVIPLPNFNKFLPSRYISFKRSSTQLYTSIETLIISGVVETLSIPDLVHLDMSGFDFNFKKIIMKRNHLKWINVTITPPQNTTVVIAELDFSENILEFIAPEVLYPSENLLILRLSKNNLNEMQVKHPEDFERLLLKSVKLQEVYIAENRITTFPKNFFEHNLNLEYIDMSGNNLQSIDFDVSHLVKLTNLDLQHNRIQLIDRNMYLTLNEIGTLRRNTFMNINYLKRKATDNGTIKKKHDDDYVQFRVNLGNNPFLCNCDEETSRSVEWLHSLEYLQHENGTYVCEFLGENLDMFSASEKIKTACYYQNLRKMLLIFIPIATAVIISLIVTFKLVRRCQRNKWDFQNFLKKLRDDEFDKKFLVFLSFCSEDYDFVTDHIYPQMQKALAEVINTDKNFVCIGDQEFRLGLRVHAEVVRCMEESSVAMFVVSKTFCKKDWCKMEVGEAVDQHKPIIMLMKEFVKTDEMSKVLSQVFKRYTHASWVNDSNGGHLEPDMNIISKSIIELAQRKAKTETEAEPEPEPDHEENAV